VAAAHEELIPFVRTLPNFGGVWVDQVAGGDLVVGLTNPDAATIATIEAKRPKDSRSVQIVATRHTAAELEAAVRAVSRSLRTQHPGVTLVGVARDLVGNRVRAEIAPGSVDDLDALAAQLTALANVEVVVAQVVPGHDVVCTSRDNCYNPMKAGNRVRDGSVSGANWCTQGFLVTANGTTNEYFLTAGHCAVYGASNTWYHKGFGYLGPEVATAYGWDGYDVMTVGWPDAQNSRLIYGVSGTQIITDARDPITNEGACFSGAGTNAVVCGTVTVDFRNWISETCDCEVWGGDTNLAPIPGDSGAPLYHRFWVGGGQNYWKNTPIGIIDHEYGYFAWVTAAEWVLNVTIYN